MSSAFFSAGLVQIFFFFGILFSFSVSAQNVDAVDALFAETVHYLKTSPEKTQIPLAKLQSLIATFNDRQRDKYHLYLASSLAFRGEYKEQVLLISSIIDQVTDAELRASFLYNLSDGYINLGEYEQAL
ncbi:MAG: hypothetical protein NTY70_19475, partial [Burkholderiales bacterium]|nr:hypothetical protein [Burkholderiales bacterium]